MRIGELSRETGVPVETIRYYEKEGLLEPPMRLQNNYRSYGDRHLARLRFIAHCRKLDMGLAEIREILNYDSSKPEEAGHIHELLHRQIEAVDARIRALTELQTKLYELEHSCHGHTQGHQCGIIQELSAPEAGRKPDAGSIKLAHG